MLHGLSELTSNVVKYRNNSFIDKSGQSFYVRTRKCILSNCVVDFKGLNQSDRDNFEDIFLFFVSLVNNIFSLPKYLCILLQ